MIGAARLDPHVYEEVEGDRSATSQAMMAVVIAALAAGIGTLGAGGIVGLVFGVVFGLISWAIWAYITYIIGTTLFATSETDASWGELARTTGFAQSPAVFRVFGFIPVLGPWIFFAAGLWQLAAMLIAVRQALDYQSSWRALGVVLVGFVIVNIVLGVLVTLIA